MARKLKVGDKIFWSKTIYTIDDIDESRDNNQILFTWFDDRAGRYKSIYHSTVWYVEKGLAENMIHFYEPMTLIKEIEKFKFSD